MSGRPKATRAVVPVQEKENPGEKRQTRSKAPTKASENSDKVKKILKIFCNYRNSQEIQR